jgi:transcriptional regulator with XRE-family HTH domain
MLNLVEANSEQQVSGIPTPEELAGEEVRRLRLARRWSQEEVAKRMSAAGHSNWHQTTVGKTELASRPLRLNEAVALAGLFEVPVTQLIAPITLKAEEIQAELDVVEERWTELQQAYRDAQARQEAATESAVAARAAADDAANQLGRFQARLNYLAGLRAILQGDSVDPEMYAKITAQYSLEQRQGK